MNSEKFISKSPEETKAFGIHLAKCLKGGDIICLFGDLGSGKTTLIKGIAAGLNINPTNVNSPTFVLMNIYEGLPPLYHFDLYRLEDLHGISSIGYEEFLYGQGVSVIEWADRLGKYLPEQYLKIELKHKKLNERAIRLSAKNRNFNYESFMY
ncbi:MAG: tRNA (adenosine(37)-N6)-threonylcarbamoyltransferase complex ATPase subunit type 1 TsaE [Candidatus Omnitrophica bacterium]|nr:tRNA (adenosine(37)-N6)-threonylcarbamoyltransferase complex ATPase subunit type 1 TsaE [Candidatus Omnitrophota bacterium]